MSRYNRLVLVIAVALGMRTAAQAAVPTAGLTVGHFGPNINGALNGELVSWVWKPGEFELPTQCQNSVLSGNFDSIHEYVYGFKLNNDGLGDIPVSKFLAGNPNQKPITCIGWISDSDWSWTTKDISFMDNPSGIDIAAATPAAFHFEKTTTYSFAQDIPDGKSSDVFYFTSPWKPMLVQGEWLFNGPQGQVRVTGSHFAPIPEPAAIGLMFGLGALGFAIRRRIKNVYKVEPAGSRLDI